MKIACKTLGAFMPVAVTITCDTQIKLDAIGKLFNSTAVVAALREFTDSPDAFEGCSDIFRDAGADPADSTRLTSLIPKSML